MGLAAYLSLTIAGFLFGVTGCVLAIKGCQREAFLGILCSLGCFGLAVLVL